MTDFWRVVKSPIRFERNKTLAADLQTRRRTTPITPRRCSHHPSPPSLSPCLYHFRTVSLPLLLSLSLFSRQDRESKSLTESSRHGGRPTLYATATASSGEGDSMSLVLLVRPPTFCTSSPETMAGVLNFTPTPIFRPASTRRATNDRVFLVKSSTKASETPSASILAPPNFKAPKPKPFSVRPDRVFDILGASLALLFRLTTSVLVSGYSVTVVPAKEIPSDQYALEFAGYKLKETSKVGPRPEKPIELYDFESCPFCRKVREMVAYLDLDVLYYPCPRNGPNFRPKVAQLGGKQLYPYMVDPNTGVSMYESDDIIKYLAEKYGDGNVPLLLSLGPLTVLSEGLALIGRLGRGLSYTPSKLPSKPLEIWAYEASPFCKVVRELLVELELPHILHSCARGSPKRQILYQRVGHFQVPYLEDPNTGVQMFESAEIVDYLKATYAR